MNIEVKHDGGMLPFRKHIPVRNLAAAYEYLLTACETRRDRGLRVRIMANSPSGELWLETRNQMAMDVATSLLRSGGWLCR